VTFGTALAVKWAGATRAGFVAVALLAASENRKREARAVIGLLGMVPLVVYVLSYTRFWSHNGVDPGGWLRLQRSMVSYHLGGAGGHPYASQSIGWLLLRRPVTYSSWTA
jgi:predicted membrane-bound dolichyl-phosphate-mannose-protein mannosyltransferase